MMLVVKAFSDNQPNCCLNTLSLILCIYVEESLQSLNNRSNDYYLSLNRHATRTERGGQLSLMGMNEPPSGFCQ